MEHFYSPSSIKNRGLKAMNTKGEEVIAKFGNQSVYAIDWKFGPKRGVVVDDQGNKIMVVNPGSGAIYTDKVADGAGETITFTPTLYKSGDKAPRKICNPDDELYMLLKGQRKEVDCYSVAKLHVANLTHKPGLPSEAMHFVIFQSGVVVDVLWNKKTDLQLRRRLEELGAKWPNPEKPVFPKNTKIFRTSALSLLNHRFQMIKVDGGPIKVMDNKKHVAECSTWMESLAAIYRTTESSDTFDKAVLPILAKSLTGLISKTLRVSGDVALH